MVDIETKQINSQNNNDDSKEGFDFSIFSPREVSNEEARDILNKVYLSMDKDTPPAKDVFPILFNYFKDKGFAVEEIEKYHNTFWAMLVKISWHILSSLNDDTFAEVVARTLPYAVSQNVEIKDAVYSGFYERVYEKSQEIHDKIKEKILIFNCPIAFNDSGKGVVLSELAKTISQTKQDQDLSRFELLPKVQKALFPDSDLLPDNLKQDNIRRTTEFIEVLKFLAGDVKAEDVVVDYVVSKPEYDEPEYGDEVKGMVAANLLEKYVFSEQEGGGVETESKETKQPAEAQPKPTTEVTKKSLPELIAENKNNFREWSKHTESLRSVVDWMKQYEDKIKARIELLKLLREHLGDKSLDDEDNIFALARLDEFLTNNGYSGDELIHFDEQDLSFKWGK